MATREALRTQLDTLRVELQALEENRKLREEQQDSVERARELELTEELVPVQEENLQLTQQLSVVNSQLASEERSADAQGRMEEQVLELQQQVEEQATMVANQQQALSAAQEQMNRLQEQLEREREEAELARYRVVAQEANKWEARERRLEQQLDNLRQPPLQCRLGPGGTPATRRSWAIPINQVSGLMAFSNCTTTLTTPHTSPSLVRSPQVTTCTSNMPPLALSNVPHSSVLTTLYTTPSVSSQFNAMSNVPHSSTMTTLYTTPLVSSQFSGHPTNNPRLSPFASAFKPSDAVGNGVFLLGPLPVEGIPSILLLQHSWHNNSHLCQSFLKMCPMGKENVSLTERNGLSYVIAEVCCWID